MKTFIEFGAPYNMRGLQATPYNIIKAKEDGYRTIVIDKNKIAFHTTSSSKTYKLGNLVYPNFKKLVFFFFNHDVLNFIAGSSIT